MDIKSISIGIYTNNFDNIILNTYTNKEEYDEKLKVWMKLKTSGRLE